MRDPKRIKRILSLLQDIWEYQPDVRFNQLVSNLQHIYSQQNNGYGKRPAVIKDGVCDIQISYLDFFYLEDDEWEPFLEKYLNDLKEDK